MAGLCAPLSTLRQYPHGYLRMTRGRCGSLLLHRDGLAPSTPCRSPGALRSTPVNGHSQDRRACLKGANNGSGHLIATVDDTLRADPLAREYQVVDSVHAWFSVGGQSPKIRAGRRAPARSPDPSRLVSLSN